jgi:hypothetical protein
VENKDSLTGVDTTSSLPPSSAKVPVIDIAPSEKTEDLVTQGGSLLNAPTLFSPAVNSVVPILEKEVSPLFTDANGALAGTPPLGINSAPFGLANPSPFLDPDLVGVYEPKDSLGISLA